MMSVVRFRETSRKLLGDFTFSMRPMPMSLIEQQDRGFSIVRAIETR